MTTKTTKKSSVPSPKLTDLPPNPFQSEILELVSKARTRVKKIELLKLHRNEALVSLLIWNFDDTVFSMLPEGTVPYTPNESPEGTEHTMLAMEAKKLWHFIRGADRQTKQHQKEVMFFQMLEGLHESEAKLLIAAKDKKLHRMYKGLSANVVQEAFGWDENFVVPEPDVYPQASRSASGLVADA